MSEIMTKVVGIAIGLTVLFILLNSIVMPMYNSTGSATVTNTGMTTATYQGILLLIFILAIVGIALSFFRSTGVGK